MRKLILRAAALALLAVAVLSLSSPIPASADCGEGQQRCRCTGWVECHSGPSRTIYCPPKSGPPLDLTAPGPCSTLSSALIDLCVERTMAELSVTNSRRVSCTSRLSCEQKN